MRQHLSHLLILLLLCVLFSASFANSAKVTPHNLSISSQSADAPTTAPSQVNLTALMASKGCATFAALLAATADAHQAFVSNVDGGLTVFCPLDQAMEPFLPKFKNLTADGELSLLLYHAVPVYNSIQMLQTGNGVVNTLATDGTARNYNLTVQNDGYQVTLRTRITVATITATLFDEEPLAVYAIEAVLEPAELFKPVETPVPAPEPEPAKKEAAAPQNGKSASEKAAPPTPAGPEKQPADQKAASKSAAVRNGLCWWTAVVATAAITAAVLAMAA